MYEHIGLIIKELRKRKGISANSLAKAMNIYPMQLSRIENGSFPLKNGQLEVVCNYLECDVWKIFLEEKYEEKPMKKKKTNRPNAKFTKQEVLQIREMYSIDGCPISILADIYNTTTVTIRDMVNGKTYRFEDNV